MTADVSPLWQGEEMLVPATLRGYRGWVVRNGKLRSTGVSHSWDGPEAVARCLSPTLVGGSDPDCPCDLCVHNVHPSPVRDCSCGIYGWYDPTDTRLIEADVFGVVEVTCRAVLASHGFRAERARIVALVIDGRRIPAASLITLTFGRVPAGADELHEIARWAKTQGIPVFASRAEMLAQFPPQDVSALVDHTCDEACQAHEPYSASFMGAFTFGLGSSLTASSTYVRRQAPPVPACQKRLHKAFAAWFLIWALAGLVFFSIDPAPVTAAAPVLNAGMGVFWSWHLWKQHRAPHELEVATDDDADQEPSS